MKDGDCKKSVIALINDIKNKTIDPKSLNIYTRRECVNYLMLSGLSSVEMAHLFNVDERTIRRDKKEIRSANALAIDDRTKEEFLGWACVKAERTQQEFLRIFRSSGASVTEKLRALSFDWNVHKGLLKILSESGVFLESDKMAYKEDKEEDFVLPEDLKHQKEIYELTISDLQNQIIKIDSQLED